MDRKNEVTGLIESTIGLSIPIPGDGPISPIASSHGYVSVLPSKTLGFKGTE